MKNNQLHFLRALPVWRGILYVLLSLLVSTATLTLLLFSIIQIQENYSWADFLVKTITALLGGRQAATIGFLLVFFFCLFLFYRRERQRYIAAELRQLIRETGMIASGQLDYRLEEREAAGLGELAARINQIAVQARQAALEERRAEQIKNELVTNVAHDLRSPLTSIIGYLNLIHEDEYRDEVELRAYIQIVYAKAQRLHGVLNDLFEYTYVQNKEILVNTESINIEEMMNQLVVQHRLEAEEAGMHMRTFITSENPVIPGDGNKIARVFENLIQNAIRYGKEGKYIDLTVRDTCQTVEVEVKNYGKTIPSVDLPYIFERFYRVEKSRSEFTGGSGLGLAIAKGIVQLHGGEIEAKSTAGATSFVVRLLKKT